MSKLLMGIDIGTGSTKGVLTSPDGVIVAQHVIEHGVSMPAHGFVEQDAERIWWNETVTVIRTLLAGRSGADVAGVAVSAIGPCLLPLDAQDNPLRPGILYGVDTRATWEIEQLNAELGVDQIFQHSRMVLTSQAVGPKLRWIQYHEPEVWAKARLFTTASSFVTSRLTGQHVRDHHTASHYMPLYDPATHTWNANYVEYFGVSGRLPQLAWSDELAGVITEQAATQTGLRAGTPVAVGAVDALSEAISVGVMQPGDLMIMYGSTTFFILVQNVATPNLCTWSVAGAFEGQTNLAAGMSTTGSITKWFRDHLAPDLSGDQGYAALFQKAAHIPAGANGLLFLPYFSGERTPINDPHAKGAILGLSLNNTRDDLFRAVLEGVGFGIRHNLDAFDNQGAKINRIIAVGGGTRNRIWPQIVSDITGIVQYIPKITVGACYGDAFLAGLVSGLVQRSDITKWVGSLESVEPNITNKAIYDPLYIDYQDLYESTKKIAHNLNKV